MCTRIGLGKNHIIQLKFRFLPGLKNPSSGQLVKNFQNTNDVSGTDIQTSKDG